MINIRPFFSTHGVQTIQLTRQTLIPSLRFYTNFGVKPQQQIGSGKCRL